MASHPRNEAKEEKTAQPEDLPEADTLVNEELFSIRAPVWEPLGPGQGGKVFWRLQWPPDSTHVLLLEIEGSWQLRLYLRHFWGSPLEATILSIVPPEGGDGLADFLSLLAFLHVASKLKSEWETMQGTRLPPLSSASQRRLFRSTGGPKVTPRRWEAWGRWSKATQRALWAYYCWNWRFGPSQPVCLRVCVDGTIIDGILIF